MCRHAALCVATLALGAPVAASAATSPDFDGALSLMVVQGPEYLGARKSSSSVRPGFFLRYGRVTVSASGGFAAAKRQGESRGLGIDVSRSDDLDVDLGLRVDGGRDESDSDALAGMGNVKRTVRARLAAEWRFAKDWKLGGSWTVDAFGRGGGNLGEATLRRDWHVGDRYTYTAGGGLTIAGDRYMQTYFGVTPEQSARSGYPVYTPKFSVRDVSAFVAVRAELGLRWVVIGSIGYSRLLSDAADSPLAQRDGWFGATAGLGYRF